MRKTGNITEDGVRDLVTFSLVSGIYFKERFGFSYFPCVSMGRVTGTFFFFFPLCDTLFVFIPHRPVIDK